MKTKNLNLRSDVIVTYNIEGYLHGVFYWAVFGTITPFIKHRWEGRIIVGNKKGSDKDLFHTKELI